MAELDEEIRGAPGRMLLVQEQGLLHGLGGGGRRGASVAGCQRGAVPAKLLAEVSDRAGPKAEGLGDHGRRLSGLGAGEQPLTHRRGKGKRHWSTP